MNYFKLVHSQVGEPKTKKKGEGDTVAALTKGFNPEEDIIDRRMLYEITGRRQTNDYLFSDSDED